MTETVDCIVVGAGVVGLAVARALALAGREVIILEAADMIGTGTSSRNSEVIHAGIYYPQGSLKARYCVAGRDFLYRYCVERGVEHRRCGKLIVATSDDQLASLDGIRRHAHANGVGDLVEIDGTAARALEPNLHCLKALHSPSTGIIDSHGLMLAYQGDAENRGAVVAFNSTVVGGAVGEDGINVDVATAGDTSLMRLRCRSLVNSAGLHAHTIAGKLAGMPQNLVPAIQYAKGNYFSLAQRSPFTRLIYPIPEKGGLGVHITLDLAGQARFGPDVEWIEAIDYAVDPQRANKFYAEVRKYWPGLPDGALLPAYSGVRPKLPIATYPSPDFVIQGQEVHGIPGLINLFGIESPGLTASAAIADAVAARLAA
jgi:L-2-hydroxyglutarate oxidase LhgO